MTVKELRKALKAMPQDAEVVIGWDPIDFDAVMTTAAEVGDVVNITYGVVVVEPKPQPHPLNRAN